MEINSVSIVSKNIYMGQEQSGEKAEQISRQRRSQEQPGIQEASGSQQAGKQVAREEILNKIKEISEDGDYSVRFEKDDELKELIVKVVDRDTGEVVRQVPPEEILGMKKYLEDLRGNLADSVE